MNLQLPSYPSSDVSQIDLFSHFEVEPSLKYNTSKAPCLVQIVKKLPKNSIRVKASLF